MRTISALVLFLLPVAACVDAQDLICDGRRADCASAGESWCRGESLFNGAKFDVGGYAKLDAIFDLNDAGDPFQFDPRGIPIAGGGGEQTTFHARQSRLNLGVEIPTDYGPVDFFVEGDFFGSGNAFRLRHAYGRWDRLLAGQTWSLLVDEDAFIETLDFAGADGNATIRSPQVRWSLPLNKWMAWKISLEDNNINPDANVPGVTRNRRPVLATSLRLGGSDRHLYWFGGVTESRFVPDVGTDETATVWATGVSTRIPLGQRDSLIGKAIVGDGADSLVSTRGVADASLAVPVGSFETLTEYGYDIAYQHYWREDLRSNVAYRWAQLDNSATQAGDALRSVQYLAANLIWRPVPQVDFGVEYLFGQRENKNGQSADANRLQFSFIWRLP